MPRQPAMTPPSPDPDPSSIPPSPSTGHSEAEWDNLPDYNLTDIQFRAIELTVQGFGDAQIAENLSINRKTLWRWKTFDDDYRSALHDARSQVFSGVTDRYRTLLLRATSVLAKFLDDDDEEKRFRSAYALLMMAGCFKPPAPRKLIQNESPGKNDIDDDFPCPHLGPKVG